MSCRYRTKWQYFAAKPQNSISQKPHPSSPPHFSRHTDLANYPFTNHCRFVVLIGMSAYARLCTFASRARPSKSVMCAPSEGQDTDSRSPNSSTLLTLALPAVRRRSTNSLLDPGHPVVDDAFLISDPQGVSSLLCAAPVSAPVVESASAVHDRNQRNKLNNHHHGHQLHLQRPSRQAAGFL